MFYRETGRGRLLAILHGGPDFNMNYLLPELDRLADSLRLIYYDQRGRGRSAGEVRPEEVSLASEIEDLERLRVHFGLESLAILGHSWGGLLAMEYAIRHPDRTSHLVFLNSAPASRDDFLLYRGDRLEKAAGDLEKLKEIRSTTSYQQGDLETDAAYYRIHFRTTVKHPEHLERVVSSLRSSFTREGIVKAREIEDRLVEETWLSSDYDLFPGLERLRIPALVIHGDHDLVPAACAAHVAKAIPGARFVLLEDTGHFSFIERLEMVCKEIHEFFQNT